MKLEVLVAMHKSSPLPSDPVYRPIQVGAAQAAPLPIPGILRDEEGENISRKNPNYCELTALYWGWKHSKADYLGLVHYRRYFGRRGKASVWERIAGGETLLQKAEKTGILLPKKRNYWIESNYSQYVHAHHPEDLDITRQILQEKFPQFIPAFDRVMKRTSGHRLNMLVMRRDLLDDYCAWLFAVLEELEARLDISAYSKNDARVFGFVSERLLDVWLETRQLPYEELPVLCTEPVNWWKKGWAFLQRKFTAGQKGKPV